MSLKRKNVFETVCTYCRRSVNLDQVEPAKFICPFCKRKHYFIGKILSIEISSTGYINKDDLIAGLTFGWALILILIPVLSGKFSDKLASIYLLTCMGPLFLSVIYSGYLTFKSGVQRRKFVFSDWFSNNSYKAGAGLYVDTNSELWGIVKIIAGLVAVVYLVWDVFPK